MKYLGVIAMVVCFVVIPISTYAQTQDTSQGFGLIPCGNIVDENGAVGTDQCKFEDFIELGRNLIRYLVLLSIPLAAIAFAYAGFLYITSGGDSKAKGQARGIFMKVLIGFVFVLTAWLIVYTLTSFLTEDFSYLD